MLPDLSFREVIAKIEVVAIQIALVVGSGFPFLVTPSDGDIRRFTMQDSRHICLLENCHAEHGETNFSGGVAFDPGGWCLREEKGLVPGGAVVVDDVPSGSKVAGVPARVLG